MGFENFLFVVEFESNKREHDFCRHDEGEEFVMCREEVFDVYPRFVVESEGSILELSLRTINEVAISFALCNDVDATLETVKYLLSALGFVKVLKCQGMDLEDPYDLGVFIEIVRPVVERFRAYWVLYNGCEKSFKATSEQARAHFFKRL